MYSVATALPVEELDSGTYMLSGPAMSGKLDVLIDIMIPGEGVDEGALVTTNNEGTGKILEMLEERSTLTPGERLRFVDCVSEHQDTQFPEDSVEYVSSPADLTGIGIAVSEQMRRFVEADLEHIRMGFHSISTLLMYSEVETVFRFLHVLTGRVDGIDGMGIFTIDPTTHEEGTINTLTQLFDGVIDIRTGESGQEVRFRGISGAPSGWGPLH